MSVTNFVHVNIIYFDQSFLLYEMYVPRAHLKKGTLTSKSKTQGSH